jgi:integration host factor subunit beta
MAQHTRRSRVETVTKKDLVDKIAEKRPDINKTTISEVVQIFLQTIEDSLVAGQRIELRDFGVFSPKERAARTARNPKTGAPVEVPATRVAAYKIGKQLKERLAGSVAKK